MRVLVVDDEASVATGIRRALAAEGFAVDVAADGRDGLERARDGRYDVVLLDIMLPGVNGYEICRTLRSEGNEAAILMLSAKNGEWDVAEGLELGADDYLTKPFSMVELVARIRARLRRPVRAGGAARVLVNGDLRFDPVVRRCWRGDEEVELTGRESSLLLALFGRAGDVVTKQELLDRAWGDGHRGDVNVLEVYIGRLRRKVDGPFGAEDIETIRGVGYRLRLAP